MQLQTPIQPIETSKPAVEAVCQFVIVQFGEGEQYANARIMLNDEDGKTVSSHQVNFTEEELAGWGTDDLFVLNLALDKLGIAHQGAALAQK
jgi:hypothetical protein